MSDDMSIRDLEIRVLALEQIVNELRAIIAAFDQRLIAGEQQLAGRWQSVAGS